MDKVSELDALNIENVILKLQMLEMQSVTLRYQHGELTTQREKLIEDLRMKVGAEPTDMYDPNQKQFVAAK